MKINIFLDNLGATQTAYTTIMQLNNIYKENSGIDMTVFYNDLSSFCIQPRFGVFHVVEGWGQEGVGISTSFNNTEKMLSFPRLNSKIYYMWDLDFLRLYPKYYDIGRNIICNSQLKLICRSQSHADLIKNNFNRTVDFVVDNFNMKGILEFLESDASR